MDLEAHAVARSVEEGVGPAGFGDDVPAGLVDRRRLHTLAHRLPAGPRAKFRVVEPLPHLGIA